jgi:putative DNA primase/helicase
MGEIGMKEFFEILYEYREDEDYIGIWQKNGSISTWFCGEDATESAEAFVAAMEPQDVYYQVGLSGKDHGASLRCSTKVEDNRPVVGLPCLFADIDVANDKKPHLPNTKEDAVTFAQGLPIRPNVIVDSGTGIQALWVFKEIWRLDSQEDREAAIIMLKRLKQMVFEYGAENGWKFDPAYDLARLLRIPGSYNCKPVESGENGGEPIQAKVLIVEDVRYNPPDDFDAVLPEYDTLNDISSEELEKIQLDDYVVDFEVEIPKGQFKNWMEDLEEFRNSWNLEKEHIKLNEKGKPGSGYDQSLANVLIKYGVSDQTVVDVITAFRRKNGDDLKKLVNNKTYLKNTLRKAKFKKNEQENNDINNLNGGQNDGQNGGQIDNSLPNAKDAKRLISEALFNMLGIWIVKLIEHDLDPPQFHLVVLHDNKEIDVHIGKAADLGNPEKVQLALWAAKDFQIPCFSKKKWITEVLYVLSNLREFKDGGAGSAKGKIKDALIQYLEGQTILSPQESYLTSKGRKPYVSVGCWHFKYESFVKFYADQFYKVLDQTDTLSIFEQLGIKAKLTTVRFKDSKNAEKKTTIRSWRIPFTIIKPDLENHKRGVDPDNENDNTCSLNSLKTNKYVTSAGETNSNNSDDLESQVTTEAQEAQVLPFKSKK